MPKARRIPKSESPETDDVEVTLKKMDKQDSMEKITRLKKMELQKRTLEREKEVLNVEKEIKDLKGEVSARPPVNIPPAVVEHVMNLPPDQQQKYVMMYGALANASRSTGDNTGNLVAMMMLGNMNQQAQQNQPFSIKDIAEVFKAGVEAAKSQGGGGQAEVFKTVIELMGPIYSTMSQKDQILFSERLKGMEDKIVNPVEYLKEIRDVGQSLGLSTQADPNIQMQLTKIQGENAMALEKMRQDGERWKLEFDAKIKGDEAKNETLRSAITGPLGRVAEALGGAAAGKMAAGKPSVQQPKVTMINCPACNGSFYGVEGADRVICQHCGQELISEAKAIRGARPTKETPVVEESEVQAETKEDEAATG